MRALQLVVALLLVGCAQLPAAPPPTEIPFRRTEDGRIVVDARIAGRGPYPLIVDTGASVTLIDPTLAAEIGLDPAAGFPVEVYGVAGVATAVAHPSVLIEMGEDAITPDWVAVLALPESESARGVIGVDVLSQRVVEIDGEARALRLRLTAYNPSPGLSTSSTELMVDAHGLPFVEIAVNGEPGLALVDTGLPTMILVPEYADRARVPSEDIPVTFVDVMSQVTAVRRSGRARLSLDRKRWIVERVALVRPPVLDLIEAPAEAILGAGVFAESTLVLDFERSTLYVVDQPVGRLSRRTQ